MLLFSLDEFNWNSWTKLKWSHNHFSSFFSHVNWLNKVEFRFFHLIPKLCDCVSLYVLYSCDFRMIARLFFISLIYIYRYVNVYTINTFGWFLLYFCLVLCWFCAFVFKRKGWNASERKATTKRDEKNC